MRFLPRLTTRPLPPACVQGVLGALGLDQHPAIADAVPWIK